MYEIIIKDYINKLTEDDIIKFGKKKNINISKKDSKILYVYAKNYWREFYKGNPKELINELKEVLEKDTFNKLYMLYLDLKKKIS
ncbi:MAG: DUF2624 family protein [bacterium]|nr:DUF2624 family protein [bacterium]